MTKPDLVKLKELFPKLTGTRQRDGVLILMPVEFLTDKDIEAIATRMLKLAEDKQELQEVFRGIFTCNSSRPCSLCSSHGGIISNLIGLAARKGDPHER